MLDLANPSLLKSRAYIDGRWLPSNRGATFNVVCPSDGEPVGQVPNMGASETAEAIEGAHKALSAWKALTAKARSDVLKALFNLLHTNKLDLARILAAESGKPLVEATAEIAYGAAYVEWFAEEARRAYGDVIPSNSPGSRIVVTKEPVGVCAAITPWNFPNAMITRKIAPALAAGCTIVVKPSEETPLSALAIAALAEQAGVPRGVLSVITSNKSAEVGEELTQNPLVKKLSFTGSTRVGKMLAAQAASTVKRLSLELGGNAPFIVFEDADLDAAVTGAMASKFRNAGQTCVCANRILVQRGVFDEFRDKLQQAAQNLKTGHWSERETTLGPLINSAAAQKMDDLVEDALETGGDLICGGKRHRSNTLFFEPTIIKANQSAAAFREEIFGPMAVLYTFDDEDEVIGMANDVNVGLAAYFYTQDLARSWRVGDALEYGMIGINTGVISNEAAPFGGVKESGQGREGSKYGLNDYMEIKYRAIGL